MERVPYASAVGSLMYAQVCTHLDITFIVNALGRYLSNPGCPDDRKSTSDLVFKMAGGAISWKSIKQTLTTTSTMEAEYVACYEATCQAMWLKNLISYFKVVESISRPLVIFCDNTTAVYFSQNTKSSSKSKHFDIKYLFVREKILEFQTRIEHLATENMLADPLTKGLTVGVFQRHVTHMGLVKSFDILD